MKFNFLYFFVQSQQQFNKNSTRYLNKYQNQKEYQKKYYELKLSHQTYQSTLSLFWL